jgi:hypothetical protein
MSVPTRLAVLNLYRRILRVQKNWVSGNPSDTASDKQYILDETRRLFRQNKYLTSAEQVQERLMEGEARLELGTLL